MKQIEKRDSVLTSKQQIDRLLRPGSTYFNLNPFEVLQIEPDNTVDQIKKKYRSLSILVHPDKNQGSKDRAQVAFEIINRAWKTLENDITRKKCLDVYEEAKERTDHMVNQFKHRENIRLLFNYCIMILDCREEEKNEKRWEDRRNS